MNIVKEITGQRNPALVSQVQRTFENYRQLSERHSTFSIPLPSDLASMDATLREFCAAIPAMQKEAEGSAEASAYLYAGLVQVAPIGKQAVARITAEIARLEKERAEAERQRQMEELHRREEEKLRQAAERWREEEQQRQRQKHQEKIARLRKAHNAHMTGKTVFAVLYWGGIIAALSIIFTIQGFIDFGPLALVFIGSCIFNGVMIYNIHNVVYGIISPIVVVIILIASYGSTAQTAMCILLFHCALSLFILIMKKWEWEGERDLEWEEKWKKEHEE